MRVRARKSRQARSGRVGVVVAIAALAAAAALAGSSAAAQPPPAAADATRVRLANDWARWVPGRAGAKTVPVSRSRARTLRIRLPRGARPGTVAYYRLTLPRGLRPTALTFRATYRTRGAQAFIASGKLARRVWTRKGVIRRRAVARARLGGRRVVIVGIAARSWLRAPAEIRVHSYAISLAGLRTPLPRGSEPGRLVPLDTAPGGSPAAPGERDTGPRILWGARIGGSHYGGDHQDAPWDTRSLALFERHAGKGVSLILWGQPWYWNGVPQGFDAAVMDSVRRHGAIPVVDWSPWDLAAGGSPDQPDFQLSDVISGRYDAYIRSWARTAAAWGHPFFIRLCHEMNGAWYPWGERANGNSSGEFVRMWRHVHDIFDAEGATNVSWVWSPNEFEGWSGVPIEQLYPGAAYVDWAGMSGYNWGTVAGGSQWRAFEKTFTKTYAGLRAVAQGKPLMITEVGSSEQGGSKAAWIRDAFQVELPQRFPAVKGVIWWNRTDEGMDWPIETSAAAQAAFAESIASPYYAGNEFANLSASPIPPP